MTMMTTTFSYECSFINELLTETSRDTKRDNIINQLLI